MNMPQLSFISQTLFIMLKCGTLLDMLKCFGLLAQLVEQQTLNLQVQGSSPWRPTILPFALVEM